MQGEITQSKRRKNMRPVTRLARPLRPAPRIGPISKTSNTFCSSRRTRNRLKTSRPADFPRYSWRCL